MITPEKKSVSLDMDSHPEKTSCKTIEGRFDSLTGDQLKLKNKEGKEFSRTLAKDAKLTCDGVDCKPADLKADSRIRFTPSANDRTVVTHIESIVEQKEFNR